MQLVRLALLAGVALATCAPAQEAIRLKTRTLVPRPAASPLRGRMADRTHLLVQFRSYPGRDVREALARRGIVVVGYVPDNALMISAVRGADLSGLEVNWAGPLEAADKLSPRLAANSAPAYVVIFHGDVDMAGARNLVLALGLDVIENPYLLPHHLLVSGSYSQLARLAASDAVAYILPASVDLLTGAPVQGCGGALAEAGPIADYALVSAGWAKDSSGVVALQYYVQSLTEKMDEATVRGEIDRALREWQKYAPIRLTAGQAADTARTIAIRFARGAHGDSYPFDGPGGILGHTYYPAPPNSEPVAGDMHLDADEAWAAGTAVDLYSVVLHEVGHALGLGHSDVPGAVMYPYYRQASGLTADDVAGIQALYGSGGAPAADPGTPALPPPDPSTPSEPATPTLPPPTPTTPTEPAEPALPPPTTPTPSTPTTPTAPGTPSAPSSDRTPPSLAIVSPATTIVSTYSVSLTISGTASDDVGVTAVKWSTSNGDAGAASGTKNWTAAVPLLVGTNVVTVRAYDAAGNSSWRAVTVVRH